MRGKNFIICGFVGWCLEIFFTCLHAFGRKDKKLMGHTSAWMFPIYGLASCIGTIAPKIAHWSLFLRGLFYGAAILITEYITGSILSFFDVCPWNYTGKKYSIKGLIRLDYLPFWMIAGLLYEKLLLMLNQAFVKE